MDRIGNDSNQDGAVNSDYVLPLFNSIINEFTLDSSFDHDRTPGWLNIQGPVVQKVDKVVHQIASFSNVLKLLGGTYIANLAKVYLRFFCI